MTAPVSDPGTFTDNQWLADSLEQNGSSTQAFTRGRVRALNLLRSDWAAAGSYSTSLNDYSGVTADAERTKLSRQLAELWRWQPDPHSRQVPLPTVEALSVANDLVEQMLDDDLAPVGVAPSPEGGVSLSIHSGLTRGAIEILNSGEIVLVLSDGYAMPFAWQWEQSDHDAQRRALAVLAGLT